jgi:hypothetical protein
LIVNYGMAVVRKPGAKYPTMGGLIRDSSVFASTPG